MKVIIAFSQDIGSPKLQRKFLGGFLCKVSGVQVEPCPLSQHLVGLAHGNK